MNDPLNIHVHQNGAKMSSDLVTAPQWSSDMPPVGTSCGTSEDSFLTSS
ncbi:hypothetical protein NKI61_23635 [Mesorhizobium sp. M0514]